MQPLLECGVVGGSVKTSGSVMFSMLAAESGVERCCRLVHVAGPERRKDNDEGHKAVK